MRGRTSSLFLVLCVLVGCDGGKPKGDLPTLYSTKGKVVRGGQNVPGGAVKFTLTPETAESRDLIVAAELKADGTFELFTLHSVSQKKATGAPTGTYQVTFTPSQGDQTQGGMIQPVTLPSTVTVKTEPNDLTIDVGKK